MVFNIFESSFEEAILLTNKEKILRDAVIVISINKLNLFENISLLEKLIFYCRQLGNLMIYMIICFFCS